LDFHTVAVRTKISEKYLKAIEADDRSCFPSGFFYKSFVSQYAQALSVDSREIDAEINQLLSADAPLPLPGEQGEILRHVEPLVAAPRVMRARMLASLAVLALALMACSGFYVWWRKIQVANAGGIAARSAPVEARVAEPQPPPAAAATAVPVSLPSGAVSVQPAPAQPVATQLPAPAPPAVPTPGFKVLLDLMAKEETWLSASSDGKMVFQGILAANATKTIEGKEVAKLRVGNAGGLEVRLNGKLLAPLGGRGQVLEVVFHPDNFEIVAAPKESD
jgi:hypothetical protein